MGFLSRIFGSEKKTEVLRLEVLMHYDLTVSSGYGAVRWTPSPTFPEPDTLLHMFSSLLIARLYGRILAVHKETRNELFERVGDAAKKVITENGAKDFEFDDWVLDVGFGGGRHTLWPWRITTSNSPALLDPKVYCAKLFAHTKPRGATSFDLKMSLGMERVLAPASILITLAGTNKESSLERLDTAILLDGMNKYYQYADRATLATQGPAWLAAQNEHWLAARRQKGLG